MGKDTARSEYWERFLQTGSVADYLTYKASSGQERLRERERQEDGRTDKGDRARAGGYADRGL